MRSRRDNIFSCLFSRKLQKLHHTEFCFYCNFIGYVVRTLLSDAGSYATLYVKINCDFPKLRLVSGCQLCFWPVCVYWRETTHLKNLVYWNISNVTSRMTSKMCHFSYFWQKINKVRWIFPHGLNCLKMMYVYILYLHSIPSFFCFWKMYTFHI